MRGYAVIGLDNPKRKANVGAVVRAAGCYGVDMVALAGCRMGSYRPDVNKAWHHMPVAEVSDLRLLTLYKCVPVAIDLVPGAQSLVTYTHPERAFYVFGAEDATLDGDLLAWCHDVVYVPTRDCMNLAAAVNVVLYDRLAKRGGTAAQQRYEETRLWRTQRQEALSGSRT